MGKDRATRADEPEKLPPEQESSSDEEGEEISKVHRSLFEDMRKGRLSWIDISATLGPNKTAEISSHKFAEKEHDEFQKKFGSQLRGGLKDDTIVHTLAKEKDKDMSKFKPLLKLVLDLDNASPPLLEVENESAATPLHNAIQARNSSLVQVNLAISYYQ